MILRSSINTTCEKGYTEAMSKKIAYRLAQREAMRVVDTWVRTNKTTVPKQEIFKALVMMDISESTARKAISALVEKGYIRRSVTSTNRTEYVQLRTVGTEL